MLLTHYAMRGNYELDSILLQLTCKRTLNFDQEKVSNEAH